MNQYAQIRLALAQDRIDGLIRDAAESRRARSARPRRPHQSVQRWVGRSMIRIGTRLDGAYSSGSTGR